MAGTKRAREVRPEEARGQGHEALAGAARGRVVAEPQMAGRGVERRGMETEAVRAPCELQGVAWKWHSPPKGPRARRGRAPKRRASRALMSELMDTTRELVENAYAESSKRTVRTAMRAFAEFDQCYAAERESLVYPRFSGDTAASLHNETTFMLFAAWLLYHGLASTSITTYVSLARTNLGASLGFQLTDKSLEIRLPRMLKGLRRLHKRMRKKRLGWRARYERLLRELIGPPTTLAAWTQLALRTTLRQGLMRGADCLPETTFLPARHATLADLTWYDAPRPHVRMLVQPAKKSEQQGKTEFIYLPQGDGVTDAYSALANMLHARRAKWGAEQDDAPLFVFDTGAVYKVAHARGLFKKSGAAIGIAEGELGAQSGRIGGATDSFNAKGTPAELQISGRWVRARLPAPLSLLPSLPIACPPRPTCFFISCTPDDDPRWRAMPRPRLRVTTPREPMRS